MNKEWIVTLILSALLVAGSLFAEQMNKTNSSQQNMTSSADKNFMTGAAEANLAEIETAKMVEQKSTDPGVKAFAARMVTDHTQASQKLSTLAETNGVSLPAAPATAERKQKEDLQKLSGKELDQAYLRTELEGHKEVISRFESEIEHGQDQEVKSYAEATLPTLQDHIRLAEHLAGELGVAGKSGLSQETKAIAMK